MNTYAITFIVILVAALVTISIYGVVQTLNKVTLPEITNDHLSNSTGQKLHVGDTLISTNRLFFVKMEQDGVLRVYQGVPDDIQNGPLWQSTMSTKMLQLKRRIRKLFKRSLSPPVYEASVGVTGILSVKDASMNHSNVWSSSTSSNNPGPYFMQMQDNGQLVVFAGVYGTSTGQIWSSPSVTVPSS